MPTAKKQRTRRITKRLIPRRRVAMRPPNLVAPQPATRDRARAEVRRHSLLSLSIVLMVFGAALLIYPFIPMIRYAIAKPVPVAPYVTRLTNAATDTTTFDTFIPTANDNTNTTADQPVLPDTELKTVAQKIAPRTRGTAKPKPLDNRLVIPTIGVDERIVEGANQDVTLSQGIWHIPNTSSPPEGGNTVLSGHRFRFLSGPRTLYLLDRLKKGDPIIVYWKGKEYDYVVRGAKIVKPNQVEILDNTTKPRLTVFTCSPLFSTKERLVLIAEPI